MRLAPCRPPSRLERSGAAAAAAAGCAGRCASAQHGAAGSRVRECEFAHQEQHERYVFLHRGWLASECAAAAAARGVRRRRSGVRRSALRPAACGARAAEPAGQGCERDPGGRRCAEAARAAARALAENFTKSGFNRFYAPERSPPPPAAAAAEAAALPRRLPRRVGAAERAPKLLSFQGHAAPNKTAGARMLGRRRTGVRRGVAAISPPRPAFPARRLCLPTGRPPGARSPRAKRSARC